MLSCIWRDQHYNKMVAEKKLLYLLLLIRIAVFNLLTHFILNIGNYSFYYRIKKPSQKNFNPDGLEKPLVNVL